MKKRIIIILGVIAIIWPVFNANAYMIVEVNLPTIVRNAELGFMGICLEKEVRTIYPEAAPNGIPVTHYKFKVLDVLKGDVPEVFEFDQYGVASPEEARKTGALFAVGSFNFEPGKEYVVYLSGASKLGVRTPMGIEQGVFNVVYSQEGKAQVVNRFSNKNLFKGVRSTKGFTKAMKAGNINPSNPPTGPIDYESFKAMVKALK